MNWLLRRLEPRRRRAFLLSFPTLRLVLGIHTVEVEKSSLRSTGGICATNAGFLLFRSLLAL